MPSKDWNYGYLFPTPVSPYPLRCYCVQIPDAPEYRAAFMDALFSLTKWYNWRRDNNETAAAVGRYLSQVIGDQLAGDFMCCCDQTNAILQFQVTNQFFQWSTVTSNTQINTYAPVTTYNSTTGESAPDHSARVDALCYACGVFIDAVCEGAIRIEQGIVNQNNLIAAVIGALSTVLAVFTAGQSYILGTALMSALIFVGDGLLTVVTIPQLENTIARHELKCALYTALGSLAPTEANLWATLSGLTGLSTDAQAILNAMNLLNTRATDSKQIFQAFIAALGEGQQASLAGFIPPCDCCTEPPHIWDWGTNVNTANDGWILLTTAILPIIGSPDIVPTPTTDGAGYMATLGIFSGGHYFNGGSYTTNPMIGMYYDLTAAEQACNLSQITLKWAQGAGFSQATLYADTGAGLVNVGAQVLGSVGSYDTKVFPINLVGVQRVAIMLNSSYLPAPATYLGYVQIAFN